MLMLLKKMRKSKLGYTLTELIVVISVLGILAVVASPFVVDYVNDAKKATDTSNAKVMEDIVKRVAVKGTNYSGAAFSLATTNAADVTDIVKHELTTVPAVQQDSTMKFFVNTKTGLVKAMKPADATADDLQID